MNQRQLQRIKDEATHLYRSGHNPAYESELQVVLSVIKAFVAEYNRLNPSSPISFIEEKRQAYESVDE